MGMFDNVNYEMDCPMCGKKVKGFQSKDKECLMETLDFWEVDKFYTSCDNCGIWIEFNLRYPREQLPIEAYKMTIEKGQGRVNKNV